MMITSSKTIKTQSNKSHPLEVFISNRFPQSILSQATADSLTENVKFSNQ
ncbi:hypothetical protein NC651_019858 [Populus alba x Populus x berolinensis]|nr:hypothetical protein NC651_019858 [Populus alba x Populus x berolinensis]